MQRDEKQVLSDPRIAILTNPGPGQPVNCSGVHLCPSDSMKEVAQVATHHESVLANHSGAAFGDSILRIRLAMDAASVFQHCSFQRR